MINNERPTRPVIEIGRLTRKLNKAVDQRDKARKDLEYYKRVISMQPHLETRYKSYEERIAGSYRIKELEARLEEQAQLIKLLQK